ncbi:glycoside hydrolase family 2 protein [Sunxiuqinia indica]|uniref:glycoside hydrolase family 2 protein n=1 Tax=Sunxiuqinia indica TaxID=2692584 RepID=UPI00135B8CB4|nr:sugar-binding domain-containing protein [Sunxiuqinia indica]
MSSNTGIFKALLIVVICLSYHLNSNAQRTRYNFNPDWKLYVGDINGAEKPGFDDSKWKEITLPYAWNQDEAFKKDIVDLSTGIAWYRKTFILPENKGIDKVFLEFEGVRHAGEFYVNGTLVGLHENGIMAVGLDVSHLLNPYPKENVIAVRTDNSWDYRERFYNQRYQWNDKNFNANYGGLPKNVYLHTTGSVYQTLPLYSTLGTVGTYVYPSRINVPEKTAIINVESEVKNETSAAVVANLDITVQDSEGKQVAHFEGTPRMISPNGQIELSASEKLSNLEFWSWGYGYLYTVTSKVVVDGKVTDEVPIRTGFRKTEFKDGMIYLNDRVLMMKGYAQRTSNEWPGVGMSVPAWLSDYSNKLMIESNGNFVRWMHITPWKQDVESCDRVGLIQVMPAGDSERDVTGRRWEQRCEVMRDAIIYNRNNPSILFYEGGNENISEAHMQDLKKIRDTYDSNGGRAIGSREMLDSKVAEYGGEMLYINKSADQPLFATEYSRDEGLRKYWDEFSPPYHKNGDGGNGGHNMDSSQVAKAFEYNRNQDSHAIENIVRWYDYWEQRPGTGTRVSSGGANIIFSDTNTHHRGAENYRRSGETDPMRIPKDNFFAHQVMWAGWVDLEKQLTHIMGHWNYEPGTVKPIYVVSGGNKVELFVNGKSKGFGKNTYRFLNTFEDIAWEAGEIKAVSYNEANEVVSEDVIKTAGEPYALKLTKMKSPAGFKADGADLAMVQVEVVDKDGQRCPTALNEISFNLKGEATWLGGIAQGPDNYVGSTTLPVECGVNRILIRSTNKDGKITVKASADDLKSASVQFETTLVEVVNGLRTELVAEGLPSNLEKGATPLTPSYAPTRRTIPILSANAGSNKEKAIMSFDDNEMSEWTNDGKLSTGWITYELEKTSRIDAISLKMTNWRRVSYPIDILIDGKKVWSGETKRSLGYILIPIEPTVGEKVTIQLTGAGTEEDAFQNVIELSGQKELDGYRLPPNANTEGQLRIVETEILQNTKDSQNL